ncbi:ARF-GAP with coiled-coil, ank repeat and ph domain-containing protein 1, partial [Plakobranchus ocellatus]
MHGSLSLWSCRNRRFSFVVLSPSKSHILQADSDDECQMWVQALQASISHAYKTANSGMDQMDRDHGKGTSTSSASPASTGKAGRDSQEHEIKQNKAK